MALPPPPPQVITNHNWHGITAGSLDKHDNVTILQEDIYSHVTKFIRRLQRKLGVRASPTECNENQPEEDDDDYNDDDDDDDDDDDVDDDDDDEDDEEEEEEDDDDDDDDDDESDEEES